MIMDKQAIVLMLKDENGAFIRELGSYTVAGHMELVDQAYAFTAGGRVFARLALSTGREVEDWEYDAIFDYYDAEIFAGLAEIDEVEGAHNPTWALSLPFDEDAAAMEEAINQIIGFHNAELNSVFEAIADKKDEYQFD